MAYGQQDYGMGAEYGYETEEERRRREEEERQREIEMMANTGMGAAAPAGSPASRSLGDIAGAYMNKRVDQAQQRVADVGEMFTDPQAALEKRLGMTGGAETEPTPVKQTITTDPTTGEQKMKIEGSVRDLSAANPLTPTVSGPAVPTAMPPAAAPQAAPQQAAPQAQAQPMARPTPVPAQLPAAGPIDPNAPRLEIGQVPTPGPGVQVAGPATAVPPTTMAAAPAGGQTPAAVAAAPGASVAQIAQAAPAAAPAAPAEPSWVGAANAAGSDFGKLVDVAAKFPEARAAIQVKLQGVVEEQRKAQEAQRIVEAAQSGDPKAMNKLEQALRPTRGKEREEVTTSDYLKAYMYARLGLNDLSAEVQAKIAGRDTKFGQIQLGNSTWSVETNAKTGEIIRAKDDEGNIATQSTINKLAAAGQKFGTQAFSSTGGSQVIPPGQANAGEEYRTVFNSTTGQFENKIITGKNAGEVYKGPAGIDKSVYTQGAKMDYGVISDYRKRFGTDKLAALDQARKDGIVKNPADEAAFLDRWSFAQGVPGYGAPGSPTIAPGSSVTGTATPAVSAAPAAPVAPAQVRPGATAAPVAGTQARPAATTAPAATTGVAGAPIRAVNEPETVYQNRVKAWEVQNSASVQQAKELAVAEKRPPAEARGKIEAKDINNQNFANSTYDLIRPIGELVKKSTGSGLGASVDSLAAFFGKGTEGAAAIAELEPMIYPILANVPRFEGAQSDYDVKTYQKAAGDFADSAKPIKTRLAALKGMITLLKKYDKAGANDWTFGSEAAAPAAAGTTSSGNKYKRVQ